ncbi:unnamed protein product [Linum trigynum]|uniref:Uncharacterized protein n=1 Tax=Linum trigynum TaxID=586398 RepID=A0AAV2E7F1_9ROSI
MLHHREDRALPVAALYNQQLVLQERGIGYLDGLRPSGSMNPAFDPAPLEPDVGVRHPKQPPARAPGNCQRPAHQRPIPPPPAASAPRPAGDPLVHRVDRHETHLGGVTSRLDRQTDLLEQMARRQGLNPDDEPGPST